MEEGALATCSGLQNIIIIIIIIINFILFIFIIIIIIIIIKYSKKFLLPPLLNAEPDLNPATEVTGLKSRPGVTLCPLTKITAYLQNGLEFGVTAL